MFVDYSNIFVLRAACCGSIDELLFDLVPQ